MVENCSNKEHMVIEEMAADTKGEIILRPKLENSKKTIALFQKQSDCSYVSCYWWVNMLFYVKLPIILLLFVS